MPDYLDLMGSEPAPPKNNKYLGLMTDYESLHQAQFESSIGAAADASPEEEARKRRIASLLGVTPETVNGSPDVARRAALQQTIENDTADAPALREKYTDADFAKLAHDQSANLGTIERISRHLASGFAGTFVGGTVEGTGHILKSLEQLTGSKSIAADYLIGHGKFTREFWQGVAPEGDDSFSGQVFQGLGQMTGQIPTAMVSMPVAALAMFGQGSVQMADKIAHDKAAQQADKDRQALEVLTGGAITAATEWVVNKMIIAPPAALALRNKWLDYAAKIALGGTTEAVQETSENVLQDLAHIAYTSPESKVAFMEAFEAGGVGAVVGTVVASIFQSALHIRGKRIQQGFQDLSDATKLQELRDRDPKAYQDFADRVVSHLAETTDGAVENIYIDANTFKQAMLDAKVDPATVANAVPSLAGQLDEALVTGGDLVIPLNDFIGQVAGTEVGDRLTPHLRATADSPSVAEMETAAKMSKDLQAQADRIMAEQGKTADMTKSANEVQKAVFDQLTATGVYAAPVSRAYASFVKNFYVTTAAEMGVSPSELYKMFPYKVTSGEIGQGQVLQGKGKVLDSVNPTGGVFEEYTPRERASMRLGDNITTLDQTMGKSPDEMVTVYRGAPANQTDIVPGDYVTTNKQLAKDYAGNGVVLEKQVKLSEVLDDRTEPSGEEYIYRPDPQGQGATESPEFKSWFGESKVVDESGKPRVVYHGTNTPSITEFESNTGLYWFTPDADAARTHAYPSYADPIPVYLALRNPASDADVVQVADEAGVDVDRDEPVRTVELSPELREALIARGYDGLIVSDSSADAGRFTSYIAFSPTQIKSATANRGTYDPNDPNILHQSLSSRKPTSKNPPEDALPSPLLVDFDLGMASGETLETNLKLMEKMLPHMRPLKGRGKDKPQKRVEAFLDRAVKNLLWLHDHMPVEMRERARLWYEGGRRVAEAWSNRYGISEMQAAAMIAVLSPQTNWLINLSQAERIADIVSTMRSYTWDDAMTATAKHISLKDEGSRAAMAVAHGKTLGELLDSPDVQDKDGVPRNYYDAAACWIRVFDQTHNTRHYNIITPEGGSAGYEKTLKGHAKTMPWGSFGFMAKAISIMLDGSSDNVHYRLGSEHKIRSFYNNIFDPASPLYTTIDTHAVAAANLLPLSGNDQEVKHAFGGAVGGSSSSVTGIRGIYYIYQEAYRRAAEQRGVLPREMQSVTWEAVRGLFEAAQKTRIKEDTAAIWERYRKGEIEQEQVWAEILELAGDITPPSWLSVPYNETVGQTYDGTSRTAMIERGDVGPVPNEGLQSVIVEVAPDPNDVELSAEWNALPNEVQAAISNKVFALVLPKALAWIGTRGRLDINIGGYEGTPNTSYSIVVEQPDKALPLARILGYVLHQNETIVTSVHPAEGLDKVDAIEILLPDGYGVREIDALYKKLWELEKYGQKLAGGHTTKNGRMLILNFSGIDNDTFADIIDEHLAGEFTIETGATYSRLLNKGEYGYDSNSDKQDSGRRYADLLQREATQLRRQELDQHKANRGVFYQAGLDRGGIQEGRGRTGQLDEAKSPADSVRVTGVRFSKSPREVLSSTFQGTNMAGQETGRLPADKNSPLHHRIYFYVNAGHGIRPEPGVGTHAHKYDISGLYDKSSGTLDAKVPPGENPNNAFELALLNAGYTGWLDRDSGTACLIGEREISPEYLGADTGSYADLPQVGPLSKSPAQQLSQELRDDKTLPQGELTGPRWVDRLQKVYPEVYAKLAEAGYIEALQAYDKPLPRYAIPFVGEASRVLQQAEQGGVRGGFDPSRLTAILTQNADYSTFLHESAHFFLTTYLALASAPNASPRIKQDAQTLLDWFGVADLAAWDAMSLEAQRKHHEAFAYNYEIYLFEGKAPNPKMQTLFERFSAWLKRIYNSITTELNQVYRDEHGEDLPILTGEVKQVMDRMIASDEQIEQAEQIRGMAPIFRSQEESGMNDEEWAAYQEMQEEAHNSALATHRTASLRQMKWLSNAKSKILRRLQATVKDIRKRITAEVTEEVNDMPIYRAKEALKKAGDIEALAVADAMGYMGYGSITELEAAIKAAPKKADLIRERTDQRMLEEHGELMDPKAQERAVDEAVHNQARARFIGVELRHLAKSSRPVRVMQEAARQAARAILGKKMLKDIRPREYVAAEARAAKAAEAALKKGDTAAATQAKEHQLLQNQLASEAMAVQAQMEKTLEAFKRVFAPDSRLGKSRDMNYVNAARAILAHYGLGSSEQPAAFYLAKIKAYDPEFYAEIEGMITAHQDQGKPMAKLTLDEAQDLADQIQALWHLSRRSKQIEIDGQLMDRKIIVGKLNDGIRALNAAPIQAGYKKAQTAWDKAKIQLMGIRAALRRVEAWTDAMDLGDPHGPFRTFIWNPISEAVTAYRVAKKDHMAKFLQLLKDNQDLFRMGPVAAPEIGYTFNQGRNNTSELLHALLHTGNISNKRKLLLGREWATINQDGETMDSQAWDRFIARAWKEGVLTEKHYDFCQKVWDLLAEMKPAAQKAHRDMYGFYFDEITATPFVTPFGAYAGGYVPAVTDPGLVTDAAMRNEQETTLVDNSFMFPTTGRGFTKARVEYNKPLLLNIGFLASHIDKVLRFVHIEPRIKDVARIVKTNRAFAAAMDEIDPTVRGDMLVPWLQRTAMQMVSIPSKGQAGRAADAVFSYLRVNTGMQIMVGNITNTLQQFTGLSIAALKVKPRYLRNALWQYVRQPKETTAMIAEKSPFMDTRINSYQFELQRTMNEILLDPNKYDKLRDFAGQHGYFLQQGTQGMVDTLTWIGAYNQAVENKETEKEAVRQADAAVRMTQSSFATEDASRIEVTSAFVRTFTHFYNYFNMMANITGTEFATAIRKLGLRKGAGRLCYVYVAGFMIPAVLSEIIVQAIGGFEDDDDDYTLGDAMQLFFGSQARALAAMAPGIGQVATAAAGRFTSAFYDDRISTSPAVSTLEATVSAPFSVYKAIAEDGSWKKASKDMLTMLGMLTRLPMGQLGKPVGYVLDVQQGRAEPESTMDVVRGLVSGKDVNRTY